MIVYRLSRTKWANDLTGNGARINGGRWNHPGTACMYTSESRALAVLEYTVNVTIHDIPRSLSIVTLEIPDDIADFPITSLPGDWAAAPAPSSTKDFGTAALSVNVHPVLCFPSAIIPIEYNYVLNPLHPGSKNFKVLDVADFIYDVRIKTV